MVRHTGDYLLGTMFLAAALILQLSQAQVHSAAKSPQIHHLGDDALDAAAASGDPAVPNSLLSGTPSATVNAVLTDLPRGTRVVVGSLDLSGARHQIRLASRNSDSGNNNSLEVARFTAETIRRFQEPETIRSLSSQARAGRNHQLIHTAAFEREPEDAKLRPNIANTVYRPATETISATAGLVNTIEISATSNTENDRAPRVFLMPHFSNSGTIHEPRECRAIGESQRVQVYADQRLPQTSSAHQMRDWCRLLISAVELKALPTVETWIGPICDIDGDTKLSIVVTNLDDCGTKSATRAPVFGCIREADFCPKSDFCGDIVYIDQHIFELPLAEVHALLSHEIAHAAICSINHHVTLRQSPDLQQKTMFFAESSTTLVQPWLNEAVAHFIELQCCDEANSLRNGAHELFTENFQRRVDAFLASSGVSPIVAAEHVLTMEERRNGSRAAATLFLAPLISTPHDLQTLICSRDSLQDRIEDLAQEPFADAFRSWTLAVASDNHDTNCLHVEKIERTLESQHCSILGTAFHCFECSDDIATLVLTCDKAAELQISIIEPAVRDDHVARAAIGERETSIP